MSDNAQVCVSAIREGGDDPRRASSPSGRPRLHWEDAGSVRYELSFSGKARGGMIDRSGVRADWREFAAAVSAVLEGRPCPALA